MTNIIYKKESYKIIGCCFEVYKDKGCGFTEQVYQECLEIEFEYQKIPFVAQPEIHLEYRNKLLKQHFRPDFICFGKIILEIKAVSKLVDKHRSQTMNYLNATNFGLALLVNFSHYPKIERERFGNRKNRRSVTDELNNLSKSP